jgi:cupin 2 domain-containing protein
VGDSLLIPPHRRHQLLATDPDPGTVWLALFWRPDE